MLHWELISLQGDKAWADCSAMAVRVLLLNYHSVRGYEKGRETEGQVVLET